MINKKTKTTILALAIASVILMLCGCQQVRLAAKMSDDVLITVGNQQGTVAEAVFLLIEEKDDYIAGLGTDQSKTQVQLWNEMVGEVTLAQYIKDSVQDKLTKIAASQEMAEEKGVYLTDEEVSECITKAQAAYSIVAVNHNVATYGITLDVVTELYKKEAIYTKLKEYLYSEQGTEVSAADTKVIEVNYVELPTSVSINDAEEMRQEIKNGTSFETACNSYGYEPVMNCVMKKGEMPSAFEDVAYALLDGELSEIVETADGLYIIQCVEDYMIAESTANNNRVIANLKEEAFNESYNTYSEKNLMRFNSDVWEGISVENV